MLIPRCDLVEYTQDLLRNLKWICTSNGFSFILRNLHLLHFTRPKFAQRPRNLLLLTIPQVRSEVSFHFVVVITRQFMSSQLSTNQTAIFTSTTVLAPINSHNTTKVHIREEQIYNIVDLLKEIPHQRTITSS